MAAFRQRRDDPNQIANVVYSSMVYGANHPYGHPLTGNEESLRAITNADVRKLYETYFRPNNSALVVVGDTTLGEIAPNLEAAFSNRQQAHVPAGVVSAA